MLVLISCQQARIAHLLGEVEATRAHLREAELHLGEGGGAHLEARVRQTRNETRFAPLDDRHLPLGVIELTDRELAVLRLLPHGLSRRELADQLFVSENTIKTHLTSIRRKLGLSGREDIAAKARELGILADG